MMLVMCIKISVKLLNSNLLNDGLSRVWQVTVWLVTIYRPADIFKQDLMLQYWGQINLYLNAAKTQDGQKPF